MLFGNAILNVGLNHWSYLTIFILLILEAFPVFGLFVPGQLILVVSGFFARLGIFNVWYLIILAILGAIIGDIMGYFLGKECGYSIISRYGKYFFFKKEYLEKTRRLMNEHTGKTLVIGRFNYLTRAFAPFVAGLTNVNFRKFIFYSLLNNFILVFVFVMIGYIFGKSYETLFNTPVKFIFFIIIIIIFGILIIYLYKYINKVK